MAEEEKKIDQNDKPTNIKAQVFFVVGGPGAGKGTQCAMLMKEFKIKHLSTGDLLREERNSGSKYAEIINNGIKEVKLVPTEITVGVIKKAMEKYMNNDGMTSFIIDGFPRDLNNLQGWNKLMNDFAEVPFLLFLQCTEEEMIKRVIARSRDKHDNIDTLKKRFAQFQNITMPVVNQFIKLNKCKTLKTIDSVQEVYKNVSTLFNEYLEPLQK
eukprot:42514_1